MHEWALAEAVINKAKEIADEKKFVEITEVTIKVGALQEIEKSILRFALEQQKTEHFKNAKFHITKAKTNLKCRICGTTWLFKKETLDEDTAEAIHFVPEVAHTYIKCPKCKSPDFEIVSGRGIWLENIKGVKLN